MSRCDVLLERLLSCLWRATIVDDASDNLDERHREKPRQAARRPNEDLVETRRLSISSRPRARWQKTAAPWGRGSPRRQSVDWSEPAPGPLAARRRRKDAERLGAKFAFALRRVDPGAALEARGRHAFQGGHRRLALPGYI